MNLADVYVFKKVASTLSFTKAARQIGISRSAVSKQISRLERNLGVVLFNRSTRAVNLSDAGRTFDSQTAKIDRTIERAAELVRKADTTPVGTVSFAMPSGLGAAMMPSLISQFQTQWPDLKLDIRFDDHVQNVTTENLDLAITVSTKLADSSLIARRLVSTRRVLAASPDYWRAKGYPEQPDDLTEHRCLGIRRGSNPSDHWEVDTGDAIAEVPVKLAMSADNDHALIMAACLDGGVVFVPEVCIASEIESGELEVRPGWVGPESYGVYAIYPHRHAAKKVKILVDHIARLLPQAKNSYRWTSSNEPLVSDIAENDAEIQKVS